VQRGDDAGGNANNYQCCDDVGLTGEFGDFNKVFYDGEGFCIHFEIEARDGTIVLAGEF
jgi:hypothetical protein